MFYCCFLFASLSFTEHEFAEDHSKWKKFEKVFNYLQK